MRTVSWFPVAALAIAALPVLAQDPQPRDATREGFFKPNADIAIGASLQPVQPPAPAVAPPVQPSAPVVESLVAEARTREALERELDRSQQEHARAVAEAARTPPPMIASPLDGTAPIVSPLGR